MKINKKIFIILAFCLCAYSKKSHGDPSHFDNNTFEYEYTDHESIDPNEVSSPPAPISSYPDYEGFRKNVEADPEFINGYLHDFLVHPENRDFNQVYNILKFLQVGLARPQKEDVSYYGRIKKFFTKKSDTDRFYDLFKVDQKNRYTWASDALREFHSFKRTPPLLAGLDQEMQKHGTLTNEAVLDNIKEYKELAQEYTSAKEKLSKMFSSVISAPLEAPQLTFLGCGSMEKLDSYEELFSMVTNIEQMANKIKTPSLERSRDPDIYFSTIISTIDGLKKISKNYFNAENLFLRSVSQQQQQLFKDKLAQSVRSVGESVATEVQKYFNA